MEAVLDLLNKNMDLLLIVTLFLIIVAFLSFIVVLRRLSKTKKQYHLLLKGVGNKNLEDLLLQNRDLIENLNNVFQELERRVKLLEIDQDYCLKNAALVRYDAFTGVGGRQSFSVALLNDQGSGIVISTIHSREYSSTYAKYIKEGKSEHALSEEEKTAIEKALNLDKN